MSDPEPTSPARRRRRRGHPRGRLWHGARLLVWLAALPLVFALMAAVMLFDRDITAPSWITRTVSERASTMLGGGSLTFGEITVRIGSDLHPRVRLLDTELRDANGTPLARIREVDATVSPRGLVFDRAALVQKVALRGTAVSLMRDVNGQVRLAFEMPDRRQGALLADGLAGLVRQIDTLRDRPVLAALEQMTLDGLAITYRDDRAGRVWTVDNGQFRFDISRSRTTAKADLDVRGAAGITRLALAMDSPRGSDAASLSVAISDAPARDLASQSAALRFLAALDAPLSATLDTALDASGRLGPIAITFDIGAGAVQPARNTAPLAFSHASAALTYDPADQHLTFDRLRVASDWGQFEATGQAFAREFSRGLPQALIGQFSVRNIALTPADLYTQPITVQQANIDLRLRLDPFRLDLGQVTLTDPALTVQARGGLTATAQGWDARLDVSSPALTPADLMRLWPVRVRPGTRQWFAENLTDGQLTDLTAGWRLHPGRAAQLAAGFAFHNGAVRFMPNLPPITGGAGYATLAEDAFVLRLDRGQVLAAQGGAVDVGGSVLQIPDVRVKNAPMVLDLTTDSTITAALSVLDQPPFAYMTKAKLPVTLADGRAVAQAHVELPLKKPLTGAEVAFGATAWLSRVRSRTLVPNRTLAGTDLDLTVDRTGMQISGRASLDGVPVSGMFTQTFGRSPPPSKVQGRITLSPQALDAFNIALPPGAVTGSGPGDITLTLPRGAPPTFTLTSSLVGLGLSVPALKWSKPPGAGGGLEVTGVLGARPRVDRLALRAPGLSASGAISLTDARQLAAATFTSVTVGNWFDGPVTLRGRGPGRAVGIEVRGGTLDLAKATFGGGRGGGGSGQSGPISVVLDRLAIADRLALTGFKGEFDTSGGFSGNFSGNFNGAAPVRGVVTPSGGRSAVRIVGDDAGAVLRAGGFLEGASGGNLDLTLVPASAAGSFDGTLAIRSLRVRDAPGIAAILDAISVVGLLQQLDGQGLAFDAVDARFRLTPDRIVVTESSAVGPGLGISLDGVYMLATKAVDFQGVVSPFYILNGIGSFLTRKGEGLIGFNFTIQGTPGAPRVGVNPLSVFTPGMFRDIFRRPAPEVPR